VTDVNGNTEKGVENEQKKLSDDLYKAGRQRLRTLILAIVSLTVPALFSFSPSVQLMLLFLLFLVFMFGLVVDINLISIFHDAVFLNLKRGVTVKALESSDEQTSTPSRQPSSTFSSRLARLTRNPLGIILASYIVEFTGFLI
jgi:hypothetical protein